MEATSVAPSRAARRLERLLAGRIPPLIARLAAPNIAVVTAMTSVTVADVWFVSHLGVAALASLALVFPVQALMQMMSAGAMGGGVSSAVARSLGAGQPARAEAVMWHAVLIALGMAGVFLWVGTGLARPLFALLGGRETVLSSVVLSGAVDYAQIALGGGVTMWLANTFASVLRGTGNMAVPAWVLIGCALLQVGLSGALTLGWGPLPALGLRGPATALVLAFALASALMGGYLLSGRGGLRLRVRGIALQWPVFRDILRVGAVACGGALLTISTVLIVTRLVASGGTAALAGYGLGSRLELMMVPISFGIGGALTVAVGTNFGARQYARARRIAWSGGLIVACVTGAVGLTGALWPELWLGHFTQDAGATAFGERYLSIVGPFYGCFGLAMALYFASQGTGNMVLPVTAGLLRLLVAAGGGAVAVILFGAGPATLFGFVAAGLLLFCGVIAASLFTRVWRPGPERDSAVS